MKRLATTLIGLCLTSTLAGANADTVGEPDGLSDRTTDQIDVLVAEHGAYSMELVDPLIEIGRRQIEDGDVIAAEESLLRAQHVIHRNEGVHALRQLEIVELLSEIHLDRDEPEDADRLQQMAVYLAERNFGKDSDDIVPALMKLERWYADTGQFQNARRTLDRAVEILSERGGEADPRLIEPLIEAARVRRLNKVCCSYKLLEQARRIVEENTSIPADDRARVYAALGDAYLASGRDSRAREAYQLGWQTLGNDIAEAQFSQPVQIAMAEDLLGSERVNKKVFRVDQDPMGFNHYRQLTVEERLGIETRPPQQFFVPLSDGERNFHIKETFGTDDPYDKTRKVVGQPFQFILPQLQQIMPLSASTEAGLAGVQVELEFTVGADGRVDDVEIHGDAPPKLKRLMRKVLYKSHFRPRLENGAPVATTNYRLLQTFD